MHRSNVKCSSIVLSLCESADIIFVLTHFLRYEVEYEEAKRKTKEALHPLKLELAEINDSVSILSCLCALRSY